MATSERYYSIMKSLPWGLADNGTCSSEESLRDLT